MLSFLQKPLLERDSPFATFTLEQLRIFTDVSSTPLVVTTIAKALFRPLFLLSGSNSFYRRDSSCDLAKEYATPLFLGKIICTITDISSLSPLKKYMVSIIC